MKISTMLNSFTFDGVFWFAGDRNSYFPGVLSYSPADGVQLTVYNDSARLIDKFQEVTTDETNPNQRVVHGSLIGKGEVTLFGVDRINSHFGLGLFGMASPEDFLHTVSKDTYSADYLFMGEKISEPEEALFEGCSFQSSYLSYWNQIFQYATSRNPGTHERLVHMPEKHDSINIHLDSIGSGLELSSVSYFQGKQGTQAYGPDVQLLHEDSVKLRPQASQSFEWYMDKIRKLQRFFALCTNRPIFVEKLNLLKSQTSGKPQPIQIFYKQPGIDKFDPSTPDNIFLLRPDLGDRLEQAFNTVFRSQEELNFEPVYELFASQYYYPDTNLINQFLNICQALETYHRKKYPEQTKVNPETYREWIKPLEQAVQALPDKPAGQDFKGTKAFLRRKINQPNEYSLQDRLNKLNKAAFSLDSLLVPTPTYFIQVVCDTRNYFTHYDQGSKTIMSGPQIYLANVQLKLWLAALLLKDMGVTEEKLIENFEQTHLYSILQQNEQFVVCKGSPELLCATVTKENPYSHRTYIQDYIEQSFAYRVDVVIQRLDAFFRKASMQDLVTKAFHIHTQPKNLTFAQYYNQMDIEQPGFMKQFKQRWRLQAIDTHALERLEANKQAMKDLAVNNDIMKLYYEHFYKVRVTHKGKESIRNLDSFFAKFCHAMCPQSYPPLDNPIKNWLGLSKESFLDAYVIITAAYQDWLDMHDGRRLLQSLRQELTKAYPVHAPLFQERTDMNLVDLLVWPEANPPKPNTAAQHQAPSSQ